MSAFYTPTNALPLATSLEEVIGHKTIAGAISTVRIAWADFIPLVVAGVVASIQPQFDAINAKIFTNDTDNNVSVGLNVRPDNFVNTGLSLIKGQSNILVGTDILTASNALAQFSVFVGPSAAKDANNLYCCVGVGLRTLWKLVDGQYVVAVGTDAGYSLIFASNSYLSGSKAALNVTDIQSSSIAGNSVAYAGGTLLNMTIFGGSAHDGNQTATDYSVSDGFLMGGFSGRRVVGQYNHFTGNNSASITIVTGSFNHGDGRSCFAALLGGSQNTSTGDGSGANVATGNGTCSFGFGSGATGDYSNFIAIGSSVKATATNEIRVGNTTNTVFRIYGTFEPMTDNAFALGATAKRWTAVYAVNGTIQTSDENDKIIEGEIDGKMALRLVKAVKPVFYRWKDGGFDPQEEDATDEVSVFETVTKYRDKLIEHEDGTKTIEQEEYQDAEKVSKTVDIKVNRFVAREGVRPHAGVIAQRLRAALIKEKVDYAVWGLDDKNNPNSRQHTNPGEAMWTLWAAVNELSGMVEKLSAQNARLRAA